MYKKKKKKLLTNYTRLEEANEIFLVATSMKITKKTS